MALTATGLHLRTMFFKQNVFLLSNGDRYGVFKDTNQ